MGSAFDNGKRFKSVTFSPHTLKCTGFVYKMKHRDKVKTVRINKVEKAMASRAYRNVAKSHIKKLRNRVDTNDVHGLKGNDLVTRRSFLTDETLMHGLDPKQPILKVTDRPNPNNIFQDTTKKAANMLEGGNFMRSRPSTFYKPAEADVKLPTTSLAQKLKMSPDKLATIQAAHQPFLHPDALQFDPYDTSRSAKLKKVLVAPRQSLQARRLTTEDHRLFFSMRQQNPKLTLDEFTLLRDRAKRIQEGRQGDTCTELDTTIDEDAAIAQATQQQDNAQQIDDAATEPEDDNNDNNNTKSEPSEQEPDATGVAKTLHWEDLNWKPPRVMGLDIGTQFIGISISSLDLKDAEPYKTINLISKEQTNKDVHSLMGQVKPTYQITPQDVAEQLNSIRKKYNIVCTVVGIPESDLNQHMYDKINAFVSNMQTLHGLGNGLFEVCFVDEHSTSLQARKNMLEERERKMEEAATKEFHSATGHGKDRIKKLAHKSREHDHEYWKSKNVDAEAAKLILKRFLELIPTYGPQKVDEVQQDLIRYYGPNTMHTLM